MKHFLPQPEFMAPIIKDLKLKKNSSGTLAIIFFLYLWLYAILARKVWSRKGVTCISTRRRNKYPMQLEANIFPWKIWPATVVKPMIKEELQW